MMDEEIEYNRARYEEEKRNFERQLDSILNPPLDSLFELYHFPAITIPKCPSERYFYGIDLLNAVNCYNDIVALHYACAQCDINGITPVVTLLDNGVDMNMCNESGVTAFEYFAKCERRNNQVNEIVKYFFKHVHKLIVTGLDVHEQNRRQYDIVLSRQDMRHFIDQELMINYDDELNRMRDIKLDDRYTLRDVLNENIDLSPVIYEIKSMIEDSSYETQFPQLWCLIKLRYKQTITRDEWKPMAKIALKIVTQTYIPPRGLEIIVNALMNYDLANVLTEAFKMCLENYKIARKSRRNSNPFSIIRSPRKMLPRI